MIDETTAKRQLRLSDREVQELGERLRDFIVKWHLGAAQSSVGRMGTRAALEDELAADFTAAGRPIDEVWRKVVEVTTHSAGPAPNRKNDAPASHALGHHSVATITSPAASALSEATGSPIDSPHPLSNGPTVSAAKKP